VSAAVARLMAALAVVVGLLLATCAVPFDARPAAATVPDRSVFVIGDSLTFLAAPNVSASLANVGWSATRIDAYEGRGVDFTVQRAPDTGLRAVDALRVQYGDNADWIVALGTNEVLYRQPSTYAASIRRMLDRIGAGHRVMWVNTYLPDHPAEQAVWNAALDQAAAERNGDLAVFDVAALNAQHPEWMLYDNVHHNLEGNVAWADAIGSASRGLLLPAQPTSLAAPTVAPPAAPSGFVPVGPERVLDTRTAGVEVAPRSITPLDLKSAVPAGTNAVAINLTVVGYTASGFATAFPCASSIPGTSTVNYAGAGPPQSTSAIVQLAGDGSLCVYTLAAAHIIVDLFGAFVAESGAGMEAPGPSRLADTRPSAQPVPPAGSILHIAVPTSATAVIVNLTVDNIAADGYLTAWPCAIDRPNVSNLNYAVSEQQKSNTAVVPIGADGRLCVFNNSPAAIIVDLLAVFAPGLANVFHPVAPTRVLDTRTGTGGWVGHTAPNQIITSGPFGVPPGAVVVGSLTATGAFGAGFITTWNGVGSVPPTSVVNFVNGATRPNMLIAATASDGMFRIAQGPAGRTDIVVDITGWFAPA